MIAFRVKHNGTGVCTASVGQVGVLMAGITWVRRVGAYTLAREDGSEEVELGLSISALHSPTKERT
jgi:hypothetical protein